MFAVVGMLRFSSHRTRTQCCTNRNRNKARGRARADGGKRGAREGAEEDGRDNMRKTDRMRHGKTKSRREREFACKAESEIK